MRINKDLSLRIPGGLLALCCLAGAASLPAAESGFSPIAISLVSGVRSVAPGERFTVAIRQKMKPGYHTYWRNPGTIGLPTSVEWSLPEGFSAGRIQWPIPQLTRMAAYNVWGYEGETLLLVDITPSRSLKPGEPVTIKGVTTWMCCGKQCHPGRDELSLTLPVAKKSKANPRWRKAFEKVRSEQPRPSDTWQVACSEKGDSYILRITGKYPSPSTANPGAVHFFDYDRQISSDKSQRLKRAGDALVLTLEKEEHTGETLDRLRGILVAEKSWGNKPGFRTLAVEVPIDRKRIDQ